MASIQQSFNQMLMSAYFASGLYAQTPGAKARVALKETKRRESETESAISNKLELLREEAQGAEEITPEIETALAGVLQEKTALTKQQFNREPDEYLENYLNALVDETILETQGRLCYDGWQGLTTAEKQKEKLYYDDWEELETTAERQKEKLDYDGWEGLETTAERQKTINNQKEQLELRKKLLAGEPEVKSNKVGGN